MDLEHYCLSSHDRRRCCSAAHGCGLRRVSKCLQRLGKWKLVPRRLHGPSQPLHVGRSSRHLLRCVPGLTISDGGSLYFVYIFIGKFCLTYAWTVGSCAKIKVFWDKVALTSSRFSSTSPLFVRPNSYESILFARPCGRKSLFLTALLRLYRGKSAQMVI